MDEDKESIATVDASKVKEENLEVAGGKCLRRKWRSGLNVTGEIFNPSPMKVIFITLYQSREYIVLKPKLKYFSETWILPSVVLLAMVAYTVLAIAFYNNDG